MAQTRIKRPVPDHPDSIHVKGDIETHRSWVVDRIVDKRGDRYLIRWKGYGPEHDQWRTRSQLRNASELVKDYEDQALRFRNEKARHLGLRIRAQAAPAPTQAATQQDLLLLKNVLTALRRDTNGNKGFVAPILSYHLRSANLSANFRLECHLRPRKDRKASRHHLRKASAHHAVPLRHLCSYRYGASILW